MERVADGSAARPLAGDATLPPAGVAQDSCHDQSRRGPLLDVREAGQSWKHRRNVQLCMWMGFTSTLFMQTAVGPFLDIYMYKASGSNRLVGAVESVRGIAQIVAAPFLGTLADRVDRYRLARFQAVSRALPVALLAYTVATDTHWLLYVVMPLIAVSSHLGDTVRQALLIDNVPDGRDRTKVMSRTFSLRYVGTAAGPILQIIVLFCLGGLGTGGDSAKEGWQLPELRLTLIAGCLTYLVGDPASLLFHQVAALDASSASPEASPEATRDSREVEARAADGPCDATPAEEAVSDWRQDRVLRCCGGGVRKMWAIPILVEITFATIILGSGLSVKFFPLYFTEEFGLSPLALCALNIAEPLGVALLTQANHKVTRRIGRAAYGMLLMIAAPAALLGVTLSTSMAFVAPVFVLRTSTGRTYIPLFQSIVATCVPPEHRGKFAAMHAFRMSFFSASAFIGAWLADRYHSYRPAFLVTAVWQFCCVLLFAPVVAWMPKGARDA